jgi:hypothetical protein
LDPLNSALDFIAAAAALGTAAFGLVDASKVFRGGISNAGFGYLEAALKRFEAALNIASGVTLLDTLRANWLNGKPIDEQKSAAKSLIRLGITPQAAPKLAAAVGLTPGALQTAAEHIDQGADLTQEDINILGRFDALVEAIIDLGYERADQMYRNSAKAASALVAVVLALIAAYLLNARGMPVSYVTAIFVGIVATPIAPMAKDLTSSLQSAAGALRAVRGGA